MEWLKIIIMACQVSGGSSSVLAVRVAQRDCQKELIECVQQQKVQLNEDSISKCLLARKS